MTDSVTDMQIFGSKFWALGGLKQKSKKNILLSATWSTDGQKMARLYRETKKKKQFEAALWQTEMQKVNDKK